MQSSVILSAVTGTEGFSAVVGTMPVGARLMISFCTYLPSIPILAILAGDPITCTFAGTSRVTTEPAATTE